MTWRSYQSALRRCDAPLRDNTSARRRQRAQSAAVIVTLTASWCALVVLAAYAVAWAAGG
jgi:hypothetical protein